MHSHKQTSLQEKQTHDGIEGLLFAIAVFAGSIALGLLPLIYGMPTEVNQTIVPTEASLWLPVGEMDQQ